MDYLIYLLLGILLYFIGNFVIIFISIIKLAKFFEANPNGLPDKLPEHVQDFKDDIGEERFKELYISYKESLNE